MQQHAHLIHRVVPSSVDNSLASDNSQTKGTVEHVPGVGTNHRGTRAHTPEVGTNQQGLAAAA
eukprot:8554911-Pyramimonas_sp.AAC.3